MRCLAFEVVPNGTAQIQGAMENLHIELKNGLEHRRLERRSTMISLTCKLPLALAAAVALAILTASVPASSDQRVANFGLHNAQQQRAQPYKAIDGLKNGHDRFATKVDPPQEVEQTKMITK
jgi:hypothetical protein